MKQKDKKISQKIIFLLFSTFFLVGLFTFKDYGISVDEEFQRSSGFYWLNYILNFTEFNVQGKTIRALTIPTHWVWKWNNGSSSTIYLESQEKIESQGQDLVTANYYCSIGYNHFGAWILTGFYDQEVKNQKFESWEGIDFSYNLNSDTQISLFYGSQKGGLVCANGICAEQPGFEDGIKVTFRSLF